jgi:uncharacterized protein YjbJ (UPF0337 family)
LPALKHKACGGTAIGEVSKWFQIKGSQIQSRSLSLIAPILNHAVTAQVHDDCLNNLIHCNFPVELKPADFEVSSTTNAQQPARNNRKEKIMDKDRIEGAAKKAKGEIKDAVGKVTGDAKLQGEGKADKVEGKLQNAVGGIKDAVKKHS